MLRGFAVWGLKKDGNREGELLRMIGLFIKKRISKSQDDTGICRSGLWRTKKYRRDGELATFQCETGRKSEVDKGSSERGLVESRQEGKVEETNLPHQTRITPNKRLIRSFSRIAALKKYQLCLEISSPRLTNKCVLSSSWSRTQGHTIWLISTRTEDSGLACRTKWGNGIEEF